MFHVNMNVNICAWTIAGIEEKPKDSEKEGAGTLTQLLLQALQEYSNSRRELELGSSVMGKSISEDGLKTANKKLLVNLHLTRWST